VEVHHPTLQDLGVAVSRQNMINITQVTNCKCALLWLCHLRQCHFEC
jgi:hypothetical protein